MENLFFSVQLWLESRTTVNHKCASPVDRHDTSLRDLAPFLFKQNARLWGRIYPFYIRTVRGSLVRFSTQTISWGKGLNFLPICQIAEGNEAYRLHTRWSCNIHKGQACLRALWISEKRKGGTLYYAIRIRLPYSDRYEQPPRIISLTIFLFWKMLMEASKRRR